jgi:hypothetical protein
MSMAEEVTMPSNNGQPRRRRSALLGCLAAPLVLMLLAVGAIVALKGLVLVWRWVNPFG